MYSCCCRFSAPLEFLSSFVFLSVPVYVFLLCLSFTEYASLVASCVLATGLRGCRRLCRRIVRCFACAVLLSLHALFFLRIDGLVESYDGFFFSLASHTHHTHELNSFFMHMFFFTKINYTIMHLKYVMIFIILCPIFIVFVIVLFFVSF